MFKMDSFMWKKKIWFQSLESHKGKEIWLGCLCWEIKLAIFQKNKMLKVSTQKLEELEWKFRFSMESEIYFINSLKSSGIFRQSSSVNSEMSFGVIKSTKKTIFKSIFALASTYSKNELFLRILFEAFNNKKMDLLFDEWATMKCGLVRKFCSDLWNEINTFLIQHLFRGLGRNP